MDEYKEEKFNDFSCTEHSFGQTSKFYHLDNDYFNGIDGKCTT